MIGIEDIRDAQARVAPVLRPTPVRSADALSRLAGRTVVLKPENQQRTGSFKIRGAYNRISRLDPASTTGVVAASAGNHAQGVALAATLCGLRATIFMPRGAPLPKAQATTDYGAEVRFEADTVDDCIDVARAWAAERGAVYVAPFDDPLIVAGQGTVGLELADEVPDADVVIVPVGGGGLIAGVATALAHRRRSVRIVGVEAAGAAKVRASLDAGHPIVRPAVSTMADGIALRAVAPLTLAHIHAYVDDVVTVTEEEISAALVLLLERAKAVVEPAGAVGLAALLAGKVPARSGGPAVVVLSGGNVDPLLLVKLIDHGLSAAGRYLVVRTVVRDSPGALARLTGEVAAMGLNVLSVEHHRFGLDLGVDEVEVVLTLETRDPQHRDEVVVGLRSAARRVDLLR